ncbi:iron uptake protein [Pseudomonas sp. WN033]|nr:iron uptake protein [Pseudomonas sp. WN033]
MIWLSAGSLLLAHAGLSLLALAMDKHRKQLLPRRQLPVWFTWLVRFAGWASLILSLSACVIGMGTGVGLPYWLGVLSLVALVLILQLAYAPLAAIRIALLSLGLGLTGLLLQ